ncbi:MAG: hypothetical protein IRZ04_15565 [Rhodospirillales bacterium]|nr:hypothetical protein [Rhodospirillales bacterium]
MFDFDVITGPSPSDVPVCQRPPTPPENSPSPASKSDPSGIVDEGAAAAERAARK